MIFCISIIENAVLLTKLRNGIFKFIVLKFPKKFENRMKVVPMLFKMAVGRPEPAMPTVSDRLQDCTSF